MRALLDPTNDYVFKRLFVDALDLISAELTDPLEPWPLTLPNQGEETPVTGFYRIDEQALKALSGERLAALNQRQALAVAYAQLISTGHLRELRRCTGTNYLIYNALFSANGAIF